MSYSNSDYQNFIKILVKNLESIGVRDGMGGQGQYQVDTLWAERMTPRDKNTSLWIFTSIQVSKCSLLIIVSLYIWFYLPLLMF